MRAWIAGLVAVAGCIRTSSVACEDGTECPAGTICAPLTNPIGDACVTQGQLDACAGMDDFLPCTAAPMGYCHDHVCLPSVCGNSRVDLGESCDDGNQRSGDGCAGDCTSNETCGNGVVDGITFEQCDDGNLVDHDGCDSTCRPEQPTWTPLSLDKIGERSSPGIAYDSDHQQIVLFGGDDTAGGLLADTWLWNGLGWSQAAPRSAPSPRGAPSMTYDAQRHRVVLFGGGNFFGNLGDTWEWDGVTWTERAPQVAPSGRTGAGIAFDARRHVVVLFGGVVDNFQGSFSLADTWEWDGTRWTQRHPATTPEARGNPAMAFYPVRGRIVMFGGRDYQGLSSALVPEITYLYDGTDWTAIAPQSLTPRTGASMAWDATSQSLILFGGDTGGGPISDTWRWNGTTWTSVGGAAPAARVYYGMAADTHGVVMFGGNNETPPTTWRFSGSSWARVTAPAPQQQVQNQVAFDTRRRRAVMVDFNGFTWESDGASWTSSATTPIPALRDSMAMAYDSARQRTIAFGGELISTGASLGDTWLWDGASWIKPTGTAPQARTTELAYDVSRQRTVMFGGHSSTVGPLGDTWEWDGTTWQQIMPAHHPSPREGHVIAYDPIRARVVLFGGYDNGTVFYNDIWEWDGVDWTELHPMHSPSVREHSSLVWNTSRRRLMLFGGDTGVDSQGIDALWEWDGTDWFEVAAGSGPMARFSAAMFPERDGEGLIVFGGETSTVFGANQTLSDTWRFRWEGVGAGDRCETGADLDNDKLAGCADPDCAYVCTPLCPFGTTCVATDPHCGDGTCDSPEDCRQCQQDCGACTAVCGDAFCDPPETAASCPGDCS